MMAMKMISLFVLLLLKASKTRHNEKERGEAPKGWPKGIPFDATRHKILEYYSDETTFAFNEGKLSIDYDYTRAEAPKDWPENITFDPRDPIINTWEKPCSTNYKHPQQYRYNNQYVLLSGKIVSGKEQYYNEDYANRPEHWPKDIPFFSEMVHVFGERTNGLKWFWKRFSTNPDGRIVYKTSRGEVYSDYDWTNQTKPDDWPEDIPFDPKNPILAVKESYPALYVLLYGYVRGSISESTDRIFSRSWDHIKIAQFDQASTPSKDFDRDEKGRMQNRVSDFFPPTKSQSSQFGKKPKVDDFKARESKSESLTLISLVLCYFLGY